ncbi:hypothetical protein LZ31DRAFT_239813 [Colletotrichum somersetense]|nr:hypothetical protein LZ31DRAFT_239813 [Colletotrichum somersetense]
MGKESSSLPGHHWLSSKPRYCQKPFDWRPLRPGRNQTRGQRCGSSAEAVPVRGARPLVCSFRRHASRWLALPLPVAPGAYLSCKRQSMRGRTLGAIRNTETQQRGINEPGWDNIFVLSQDDENPASDLGQTILRVCLPISVNLEERRAGGWICGEPTFWYGARP